MKKIIRSIPVNDSFLASTLTRYPLNHSSIRKTSAGYTDDRFEEFTVYYTRKGNLFTYHLTDEESGKNWDSEAPRTLRQCGGMVGKIINERFK